MGKTTKYQLPYPAETDVANVPLDIKKIAEKIEEVLEDKQDILTAGDNITIEDSVISSSGGGSGDGSPIGSGMDYFGIIPPEGYMFSDGSEISRTEYAELFNIIGTIYGEGDGKTTFNLPDKRGRVSVAINNETFNELGKTLGEETHQLTVDEIPSHKHTFKAGTSSGAISGNGIVATSGSQSLTLNNYSGYKAMADAMLDAGGNTAHNIIQPSLVCNYIIKVK